MGGEWPLAELRKADCGVLVVAADVEKDWPVIGFDTFGGFPPRRSPLDMYQHPRCNFTDLAAVRRYLGRRDIEIIVGNIAGTCRRLDGEDLVLTFIDTDNYTPASSEAGR